MFAERDFGLYELYLFCLVSRTGSFTRAGELAGLTQSAVSRQIQRMEVSLGVALFERTTRKVILTEAGADLNAEALRLLGEFDALRQRFEERHAAAPRTVRVGVSRSIGVAYLPGFYVAFQRQDPDCRLLTEHGCSSELLQRLSEYKLDVLLCSRRGKWPSGLEEAYQFEDEFVAIAPAGSTAPETPEAELLRNQPLLLMTPASETGRLIAAWLERHHPGLTAASEFDSFDLIINLVALGGGVSIVPRRALAPYRRTGKVRAFRLRHKFIRAVSAVCRRDRKRSPHVDRFIDTILF